jgi:hypothetical protein
VLSPFSLLQVGVFWVQQEPWCALNPTLHVCEHVVLMLLIFFAIKSFTFALDFLFVNDEIKVLHNFFHFCFNAQFFIPFAFYAMHAFYCMLTLHLAYVQGQVYASQATS